MAEVLTGATKITRQEDAKIFVQITCLGIITEINVFQTAPLINIVTWAHINARVGAFILTFTTIMIKPANSSVQVFTMEIRIIIVKDNVHICGTNSIPPKCVLEIVQMAIIS